MTTVEVPSRARLWFGVAAAPAAWSVAELVGYIGAGRGCLAPTIAGRTFGPASSATWTLVISLLMLTVALAGAVIGVGNFRQTEPHSDDELAGRTRFMAVVGLGGSALFALGIVLFAVSPLVIHACARVR